MQRLAHGELDAEPLHVGPAAAGRQHDPVGRALIADLVAMAGQCGWSRVYWHTRAENLPARRLYDAFVQADDFVRYLLKMN